MKFFSRVTCPQFLSELAFTTDFTKYLNELYLKLQGRNRTICHLYSNVLSFKEQLSLFENNISTNNLVHFPSCTSILQEFPNLDFQIYLPILQGVIAEFNSRFKDFEDIATDIHLFANPQTVEIEKQRPELQLELCDLRADVSIPKEVGDKPEEFFKLLTKEKYPNLRDLGLKMFSIFGSTYICESTFSTMKIVRNKQRNCLKDDESLENAIRLATTQIPIDINEIANDIKFNKQPQISH